MVRTINNGRVRCGTTELRDDGMTRLRDNETAGLRDHETTRLRDYGTTENTGILSRSQAFSVVRGCARQLGVRVVQQYRR